MWSHGACVLGDPSREPSASPLAGLGRALGVLLLGPLIACDSAQPSTGISHPEAEWLAEGSTFAPASNPTDMPPWPAQAMSGDVSVTDVSSAPAAGRRAPAPQPVMAEPAAAGSGGSAAPMGAGASSSVTPPLEPAADPSPSTAQAGGPGPAEADADATQTGDTEAGETPAATGMDEPAADDALPTSDVETIEPEPWPRLESAQISTPELISSRFSLAEGPVWDHCRGVMLISDASTSTLYEVTPPAQVEVFRRSTNYANGLDFDPEGHLLVAEMGPGASSGQITRVDQRGAKKVLVDRDPRGRSLHTTDDLVRANDGTIYFTDPVFPHGLSLSFELLPLPIYRLTPDGQLVEEDALSGPNGVVLSPDESVLYVASYFGGEVVKYDVDARGSLGRRRSFARGLTNADSMCMDAAGNLYVGISSGLRVFRPDGSIVTTIPIVTDDVTNCGFGGDDGTMLFITAWRSLWRVDGLPIPGLAWQIDREIACD